MESVRSLWMPRATSPEGFVDWSKTSLWISAVTMWVACLGFLLTQHV